MFGFKILKEKDFISLREEMSLAKRTLEDIGWINLSTDNFINQEMFTMGFHQMIKKSRIYFVNNPLAKHWITLTTAFVFGEGLSTPKCKEESVQEIINQFWDDEANKKCLTSFIAQQSLSNKLQVEGNLFFVLVDDEEGNTRVRLLNTLEVVDVINDKDDRSKTLFYKVKLAEKDYDYNSDSYKTATQKYYYIPDISNINPKEYGVPENKLKLDCKVYHLKINADINDKLGIPDLYCALDWIKAHKDMAGDVATLVKALSKFAWTRKIKGTSAQVNSIAGAMRSRTNLTNISTMAGQTNVENESSTLEPVDIKSGGIDVGEKGLRQMKLMICAGSGIFEHYYGDPSTGNLATAKSMELPLLKKFVIYQVIWKNIFLTILNHTIKNKIRLGLLDGEIIVDEKQKTEKVETNLNLTIDVDFPPILEEDLNQASQAFSTAKDKGLISEELASRLFMTAANVDNLDEEIEAVLDENKVKREKAEAQFNQGQQFNQNIPTKEALEIPKKPETRLARKNNYLTQKMNGYRKVLNTYFEKMRREIKENTKVSVTDNVAVGNVKYLDRILEQFGEGMKSAAKSYFPIAVQIGEKYIQSHLREKKIKVEETLYEAQGLANKVLKNRLEWNAKYIDESLIPDMIKGITEVMRESYEDEDVYREAVNTKVNAFASRVEQYVGALWTVEEAAVKEAGRDTGLLVNFIGEEDEHNCEGCENALQGNPWPINEAPIPGEQNCLGRCRHALQIAEQGE